MFQLLTAPPKKYIPFFQEDKHQLLSIEWRKGKLGYPLSFAWTSAPCCSRSCTTRTRLYPAARWRGVDCRQKQRQSVKELRRTFLCTVDTTRCLDSSHPKSDQTQASLFSVKPAIDSTSSGEISWWFLVGVEVCWVFISCYTTHISWLGQVGLNKVKIYMYWVERVMYLKCPL